MNQRKFARILIHTRWKISAVFLIFAYIQQFQLSFSVHMSKRYLFMEPRWQLLNTAIAAIPLLILFFLTRRMDIATLGSSILFTVLSLISYHVVVYHGSPFFAADIYSIGAAVNVLGGYRFIADLCTFRLGILFLIQLVIWGALFLKADWFRRKCPRLAVSCPLLIDAACIFLCFFSPWALFSKNIVTWNWLPSISEYGYGICLCNSFYSLTHSINRPENYSVDTIAAEPASEGSGARPDIILILNESLYDLNLCTDLPESAEIFQRMRNIPGVSSGYAVCPTIGGGTNNSEFELLTSNSMSILNLSAPFSSMSMKGVNSIVSYLKQLGYTTTGMHCASAVSYSRNRAYPELGFDNVVLGGDSFQYCQGHGSRPWLDSGNYEDMMLWHDAAGDNPRFTYLLTYQNHGGYEKNDESFDTIHIQSDRFGDRTGELNEYLTSIEKSADAFESLISRLSTYNRPLVVLMVGDHAPSFLPQIVSQDDLSGEERDVVFCSVPYFVWSNTDFDGSLFPEYTSMTDLIPILLKAAGMPLSPYYATILKLGQALPVRTSTGYWRDSLGQYGTIASSETYSGLVNNYLCMEYNNLKKGSDYQSAWFQPQSAMESSPS